MNDIVLILCIVGAIFAAVGYYVGGPTDQAKTNGAMLGLFFGPFGAILAAVLGNREAARLDAEAIIAAIHGAGGSAEPVAAAAAPVDIAHLSQGLAAYASSVAAPPTEPAADPLAALPDIVTVRRGGEVIGQWSRETVIEFLKIGILLSGDQYLDASNEWNELGTIA
jgi:hypothetical protein